MKQWILTLDFIIFSCYIRISLYTCTIIAYDIGLSNNVEKINKSL